MDSNYTQTNEYLEHEYFKLQETGYAYNCIATIENTTEEDFKLSVEGRELFIVPAKSWIGLLANKEGYMTLDALRNCRYEIEFAIE